MDSEDDGDQLFWASRRGGGGGGGRRGRRFRTENHHHDHHRHHSRICRPRLSLLAATVYALPFFAGVTAGLVAYHSGSGPIGAIIVGAIASSITLIAGQIAFTTLRSPLSRAVIAFLFAVPAAIAGYHAALGLAHIAIPAEGWRNAIAVAGAIIVAATAWARLALSAPPDGGRALPPA
jgi:hypothetical protein